MMQRAIDETLAYVRERQVFGEPLLAMQNTRFKLAECETEARSRAPSSTPASTRYCAGTLDVPTAAMAKWWTTDMRAESSTNACSCTAATAT